MEVSIIKIGNSKGFRLTKSILERYNITDKIELILEKGQIICAQFLNHEKAGIKHSKRCMKMVMTNF